ncbi:uncharacterized protein ISCGN_024824 [Ixodes scapularis]
MIAIFSPSTSQANPKLLRSPEMLWYGVFAIVLVAYAHAATVQEANHFMDTVLNERLPPLVRASPLLFPVVGIPFFRFDVPKNAPTNRNLHANITEGAIRNLDVGVKRMGECLAPALKDGVPTVSCTLDLNNINTTFLAYTKGDNILSTLKEIWVNVLTVDSVARFEATGNQRRESLLRTFEVPHLHFTTLYNSELHLNTDRQRQFKDHIEAKVKQTLQETLYGDYRLQLARAVAATPFPNSPVVNAAGIPAAHTVVQASSPNTVHRTHIQHAQTQYLVLSASGSSGGQAVSELFKYCHQAHQRQALPNCELKCNGSAASYNMKIQSQDQWVSIQGNDGRVSIRAPAARPSPPGKRRPTFRRERRTEALGGGSAADCDRQSEARERRTPAPSAWVGSARIGTVHKFGTTRLRAGPNWNRFHLTFSYGEGGETAIYDSESAECDFPRRHQASGCMAEDKQLEEGGGGGAYGGCEGPEAMYVKLISSDGHEFIIKRNHALTSGTIKAMLSGPGQFAENETNEVNFREIPSHVLQKVCQYFTYKVRYTNSSTEIPEFPIAPEIALELLMAANFLDC